MANPTASGKKIVGWLVALIVVLTVSMIVLQQLFWNRVQEEEDAPIPSSQAPAP